MRTKTDIATNLCDAADFAWQCPIRKASHTARIVGRDRYLDSSESKVDGNIGPFQSSYIIEAIDSYIGNPVGRLTSHEF
ncbi:hypothetical protein GCM10007872_27130 [Gluconobacter sphaericus NBRC 12467]|uniref:Uncharacterized protein n=1 Tax=Gluconobacter sphaericus NBRC 12467 TaxID=1307951 RepID=A0AA37SKC3_9PROT|nr:hypothetical protein GSP01_26470 [Gluconobacter sphaericus NBRC 12467]GLQ85803.1 hypothetical protein GCM10007872_27130 [Gluconobacter sphaericus NBRC 12467]